MGQHHLRLCDCDGGVSSSIHPALNYVFISFAVNRKLRHTHGSQVNKWPPCHYCHLLLPLFFALLLSPTLTCCFPHSHPLWQVAETSYRQKRKTKISATFMKLETVRVSDCPRPRPKNNRKKIWTRNCKKIVFSIKKFLLHADRQICHSIYP